MPRWFRLLFAAAVAGPLTLVLCLRPACAAATPASGGASEPLPGAKLPGGETALALAWLDAHTITLLVQTSQGYALRDLAIASGEFAVVNVPPSFKKLRPPAGRAASSTVITLAPDGHGLAVLEPATGPLRPATLAVYRRAGQSFDSVELRNIPANFWPASLAWGGTGNELFIAAQAYVFPEQPYSVGRLELSSGVFNGVVLKANMDLVTDMAVLRGRQWLVLRCGGFRQEYPAEPVIAVWDLSSGQSSLLHARARGLALSALDDKEALLLGSGDAPDQRWILAARDMRLRRLDPGLVARSRARSISPDGQWLGIVVAGRELTKELDAAETYVAMQETSSGRTIATAVPCLQFAFAPDSAHFAALAKDGGKVYYYALPHLAPQAASTAPAAGTDEQPAPVRREDETSRGAAEGRY